MTRKVFVIPFESAHLDSLIPRDVFSVEPDIASRIISAAEHKNNHVGTVMCGDSAIAVIGITPIWKGVAEVWSMTSERVRECPIAFHRLVLSMIDQYQHTLGLHRVYMHVKFGFHEGVRWANALGFKCEGLMKKMAQDGSDILLFGRTW